MAELSYLMGGNDQLCLEGLSQPTPVSSFHGILFKYSLTPEDYSPINWAQLNYQTQWVLCFALFCFALLFPGAQVLFMNQYPIPEFPVIRAEFKAKLKVRRQLTFVFLTLVFRELCTLDLFSKAIKQTHTHTQPSFFPKWNKTRIDQAVLRNKIVIKPCFPKTGVGITQTNVDINEICV